jgi:acyl transferase domain-containing protein
MTGLNESENATALEGVAVIGIAGRFPGARNVEQFWYNVRNGVESIRWFSDEELLAAGIDPAKLQDPNYVKAGAPLAEIDTFDAAFFGCNPREAEIMDPQQRLFMETAWEAIEHAGYNVDTLEGLVGIYAGTALSRYLLFNLLPNPGLIESVGTMPLLIANDKDHLATRTAYKLNLAGPTVNVSTACSTSLVAIHLACQSLLIGETDMALAGGVSVNVPHTTGYDFVEGSIMSPDGHCRAFSEDAHGTVSGSGVGVVVLKRLADAVDDGDTIYAVIKGSAVGNDGAHRVGYTAPSVDGQSRVIAEALALSGVEAETIRYIEAHGTGTELGDPIEIAALTEAFRAHTEETGYCDIGSVKTNIGHLDAAAGVTGLIKAALTLHHQEIVPSLHFDKPNPKIDFANSPFRVSTSLKRWEAADFPRRAGVSSFGMGGTNVHAVLEEAPAGEPTDEGRPWQLLVLSARTDNALEVATDNLVRHLQAHPEQPFADVAYTLQVGRKGFEQRRVLVCRDLEDALQSLETRDPKRLLNSSLTMKERPVAFLFTGVGDQYVNMAKELYKTEAFFKEIVDCCCDLLLPHLQLDLRDVLFHEENGKDAASGSGFDLRKMLRRDVEVDPATAKLNETIYAQPAMFVVEYALACLLMEWGVRPKAMIGHSLGEYVAACLAGVFSLEEALVLVAKRAQLINELPGGSMLAVPLPEQEVQALLGEGAGLFLATVNAPAHCVISGTNEAVSELEAKLQAQGVACSRVQTTHAFHSPLMEPAREAFTELVRQFHPQAPNVPFVSNVTGTWANAEEVTDADYWGKHLCQTVRFADGLQVLAEDETLLFLEVGPGQTLSSFAMQQKADATAKCVVLPTLRPAYDNRSDLAFLLNALGQMWLEGVEIDWKRFTSEERRQRVPLPTYPFERQRFWIDAPNRSAMAMMFAQNAHTANEEGQTTCVRVGQSHARPNLHNAYVQPRDESEAAIAEIFQELLGIEQVGIHDNFFQLGGNSLIGTQLVTRLRGAFQVELPLRTLFDAATVAELSVTIEEILINEIMQLSDDEIEAGLS